jgi:hypothetical protein
MSTSRTARRITAIDDLGRQELKAIFDLNFELALSLYEQKTKAENDTAEAEEAHYRAEADRLLQENESSFEAQVSRISAKFLDDAQGYQIIWQGLSRSLVDRQRREAADLEAKWKVSRDVERRRKAESAKVQLRTARVLAICEKFQDAITTRNTANALIENDQTPELRAVDADFAGRYRAMIVRHEQEFGDLFTHLESLVSTLKLRAVGEKSVAMAQLRAQNALNAKMMIEGVSQHSVNPITRDRVIHTFSPRNTQGLSGIKSRTTKMRSSSPTLKY